MAVAFVAGSGNTMQHATASVNDTTTQKIPAGSNFAIVAIAHDFSGETVSAVTINGTACTQLGSPDINNLAGFPAAVECWGLVNPPTGSSAIALVITMSGTVTDVYYLVSPYSGVNAVTPVRAGTYQTPTNPTTDGSGNYTLAIASNTADLVYSAVNGGGGSVGAAGAGSGGTIESNSFLGTYCAGVQHGTSAASSVNVIWNGSATSGFAAVGFSINGNPNNAGGAWVGSGTRRAPGKPGLFDRLGMLFRKYDYTPSAVVVASAILQRKTLGTTGNHVGGRQRRGQ